MSMKWTYSEYILGLQWRHQKIYIINFFDKIFTQYHNVDNLVLKSLCKFQTDILKMQDLQLFKV